MNNINKVYEIYFCLKNYIKNRPKKSIILLIIIFLSLYFLLSHKGTPKYIIAPVTRNSIGETILATGRIEPEKKINIGAQVSGQIKKVFFEVGQKVKEGDIIAIIDPRPKDNELKIAEAELKKAQASVNVYQNRLIKAQQEYDRQKFMFKNDATSKKEYLDSKSNLNIAESELKQVKENIISAKKNLETAKLNLEYTTIKAPSNGTILSLAVEEGQTLNTSFNIQTIAIIANINKLTIKSEISETDINKIHVGQDVEFSVIGNNAITYTTKVKSKDPAPTFISTPNSPTLNDAIYYFITMDAPNPNNTLKIGMNVDVKIFQTKTNNIITIPNSALNIASDNGYEVLVYLPLKDKYEHRKIELGISDGVETEVKSGLSENDYVVINKK